MTPVKIVTPPDAHFCPVPMSEPEQLVVLNCQVCEVAAAAALARNQNVSCKSLSWRLFLRIDVQPAVVGQMKTFGVNVGPEPAILSTIATWAMTTSPTATAGTLMTSS